MDRKDEVRKFLMSRRARLTPEQVGLPVADGRRVKGLRREEVAQLAGVSTGYYTRLERGRIRGASDAVLESIARVLRMNDIERSYLFNLARGFVPASQRLEESPAEGVRPSVQRVLNNLSVPAIVYNPAHDIVAANEGGRALYYPHFDTADRPNIARFIFLDSRARSYYGDWGQARRMTAAMLRLYVGRDPLNQAITAVIEELSDRSALFRQDWARQEVYEHRSGHKTFLHPHLGPIAVTFDGFEMPGEKGLSIVTYSAEPGSVDAERLGKLPTWARGEQAATWR
ncbi:helix-turn-helix domain-containing protein [Actinomyces ruminicola]|uniref:helix-turn-helix domain-containing protein n=1 Tax=Actinomyces ruminicola TaxID=332524 RepID=UPI0011C758BB|nr:helix-turn-helix transcriptional regulator [Actinomyces ruminicola]